MVDILNQFPFAINHTKLELVVNRYVRGKVKRAFRFETFSPLSLTND